MMVVFVGFSFLGAKNWQEIGDDFPINGGAWAPYNLPFYNE